MNTVVLFIDSDGVLGRTIQCYSYPEVRKAVDSILADLYIYEFSGNQWYNLQQDNVVGIYDQDDDALPLLGKIYIGMLESTS